MHKIETLIVELSQTFGDIANNKLAIFWRIAPCNRSNIKTNDLSTRIPFRDLHYPYPYQLVLFGDKLPEPVPQSRILCGSGGIGARTVSPKWALNMTWILSRRCFSSVSLGRMYDFTSLLPWNLLSAVRGQVYLLPPI
jgi:hypothetical protein